MSFYSVLPIIGFLGSWIAPIILGSFLAKKKSLSKHWLWFGFHPMLTFLAYLIIALRKERKTCPQCFSHVDIRAHKCPKCTSDLEEKSKTVYKQKAHVVAAILLAPAPLLCLFSMVPPSGTEIKHTIFSDFQHVWLRVKAQEESFYQLDSDIDLDLEGNMIGHSKANGYKMKVDIRGNEGPALLIWTARQKEENWTIDTILLINKTNGDSVYLEPRENLSNFYTPPLISHNP
ncbi:hypothetical protein [Croceimicrobium sp.]|uniref:hypothetical protein n=1 Tax=Croceimicrobium sp. TaxID=2828340 RepID=UPI003BAAEACC